MGLPDPSNSKPLQYLDYLRKQGDTDGVKRWEEHLHSSGWLEARKQHILTRNQQGQTADAEAAPGKVMQGLDAVSDMALSIPTAAADAFLTPIKGSETSGLGSRAGPAKGPPKVITKENTPGAISHREAVKAFAQTAALAAAPLVSKAVGLAAPAVAKATPTFVKAAEWLGTQTPTIGKVVAPLSRIAGTGIVGGVNNSAIQGTVGLATGDEEGNNRLQEGLHQAQEAFLPGVVGGAVLGTAGELLAGAANKLAGKVKMPASLAETPPVEPLAPTAGKVPPIGQEMHGGLPIPTGLHADVGSKFEKLASDYVADIRKTQPALHEAVHVAGASPKHALYIKQEVIPWVMEGLDDAQREQFGLQKAANSAFSRAGSAAEDVASAKSLIPTLKKEMLMAAREAVARGVPAEEVAAAPEVMAWAKQLAEANERITNGVQKATNWMNHGRRWNLALKGSVESEPWYQQANARYTDRLQPELSQAARTAGVSEDAMLDPSDYLRMFSKEPMVNKEIETAQLLHKQANPLETVVSPEGVVRDATAQEAMEHEATNAAKFIRRQPLARKIFGNPISWENEQFMGEAPQQGPWNKLGRGGSATPKIPGASKTGSAQEGLGTAADYDTDFARVLSNDALDKIPRAANNRVYQELVKAGRVLGENENVTKESGEIILKPMVIDPATGEMSTQRIAVTPEVKRAWEAYVAGTKNKSLGDSSNLWKRFTNMATKLQIGGMPVEAFSHILRTLAHVGSNTGELDQAGKLLGLVPGIGGKAAAMREMQSVDFTNPIIQKVQDRLSRIGALRTEMGQYANTDKLFGEGSVPLKQWWDSAPDRGGILQWAHHLLFGPEGVDRKARVVLALRAINRDANISDSDLRRFVNGQLGNYVEQNSGVLTNMLQKGGFSAFGRFQAASIPSSIRRTLGISDLPTTSLRQKVGDVAGTLWRGPAGYYAAGNAANMATVGHPLWENEKGHGLDIATGYAAVPGGLEADPAMTGDRRKSPLYLPFTTLDPVSSRGLRATGLRQFFPNAGTGSDVDAHVGDALRDVGNTALGVLGPAVRAVLTLARGETPYMNPDNSFMRVTPHTLTTAQQVIERLKAVVGHSNPALEAVQEPSHLVQSLEEDNGGGGTMARAAQLLQIMFPRVATAGLGGKRSEANAANRDIKDYSNFLTDAKREVNSLAGRTNDQQAKLMEYVEEVRGKYGDLKAQDAQKELMREIQTPDSKKMLQSQKRIGTFQRRIQTPTNTPLFPFNQRP